MEEKKTSKKETAIAPVTAEYAMTPAGQAEKAFAVAQRKGAMFAQSTIVPQQYQNQIGNCVIALDMAERMGAAPLMVMQNLYVVHGTPSFSSKFLIASINASKRFSPLRYEFKGEEGTPSWGCRCYAYEAGDKEQKEPLYGDWITLDMAHKEGWATKNGSKWATMPGQMLRYRAAAFWQRVYCPEISMGLISTEEAEEIPYTQYEEVTAQEPASVQEQPKKETPADVVAAAMKSSKPKGNPYNYTQIVSGQVEIPVGEEAYENR